MEQTASVEMGPGGVPKGAQTHQYYRTQDIPARFDNPGGASYVVKAPGFPVDRWAREPPLEEAPFRTSVAMPTTNYPGFPAGGQPARSVHFQPCGTWTGSFPAVPLTPIDGAKPLVDCSLGNVVYSCGYPPGVQLPQASMTAASAQSDFFQGYGGKNQHPMYRTTSAGYGANVPSVHTMPTQFHARSQKFSEHLGTCGMYRNFSLNTEADKSKV
ncbi:hypothetical protein V1264_020829 [Littorina saxatilis]|uniref:Uncharacterized protein n=1 Tax=Littorina saxatilis TaxID=31220 RepID=A0AAN9BB28_9CAEN